MNSNNLKPEILCHPHIPKPMHGVSPREIMGTQWWDIERQKVYASTNYHCAACGVHKIKAKKHQWLEAHEFWHIDYITGLCRISSIEPLCHYCHNFIHSGRLELLAGVKKSIQEVKEILEHGFRILAEQQLKCFPGTLVIAERFGCNTHGVTPYDLPGEVAPWEAWKLHWNGKLYFSPHKSLKEWAAHYGLKTSAV